MAMLKYLWLIVLNNYFVQPFTHTNFVLQEIRNCDQLNVSQVYIRHTPKKDGQYLDGYLEFPRPLDESIGGTMVIETTLDGKNYVHLFTMREKYMCKAANTYAGEFWYDIEKAAGAIPGLCPIPKRRFHIHDHRMDFSKISLQTFPFGKLRLTIKAVENKNPQNIIICILINAYNLPN